MARVLDAYGVHGWIKLEPFSAEAPALQTARYWWIRRRDRSLAPYTRTEIKPHSGTYVARLAEVEDRTAAEALKGAEIAVSRTEFPAADEDEFYWIDLVGCEVENKDGVVLGPVVEVMDNGAHAILDVRTTRIDRNGRPVHELIPFVDAIVATVDTVGKSIVVDWQVNEAE